MNDTNRRGALSGITVLDLTRVLAGPYCTMLLGDMGANIIKIENPDGGDDTRAWTPLVNEESLYFANINRNKRSVTLNLKSREGKEMFLELVRKADVVVENFRPGVMKKLGIDYEVLKKVNESIIYASVSGFGSYGPYSDRPGYDIIAQAMGGLMSITGSEEGPPTRVGTSVGDETSGMNLTIGILAALFSRQNTGKGQYLEVALVDSVVAFTSISFYKCMNGGEVPTRMGNEDILLCPFSVYRAKDGDFALCCGNQKLFESFCSEVLKKPELILDERFKDTKARSDIKNKNAFRLIIEEWSSQYTVEENTAQLVAAGIPSAPVYDAAQIMADEHISKVREMFPKVQHPAIGEMTIMGNPIKFSDTKVSIEVPAPLLGQHNEEILGSMLGLEKQKLQALKQSGVI